MPEGRIFISYRRGADSHVTGRLHDRLEQSFGRDRLFMDVDSIPPGVDFVDYLDKQVGQCEAFLAVVGPGWIEALDRLKDPADFVRIEIEAVLKRPDIPIIPVLIDDIKMPKADELPEQLHPFVRRAGIALPHDHFAAIVDGRLSRTLSAALDPKGETGAIEFPDAAQASRPDTEPDPHLIRSNPNEPVHLDLPPAISSARSKSRPSIASLIGIALGVVIGTALVWQQFFTAPDREETVEAGLWPKGYVVCGARFGGFDELNFQLIAEQLTEKKDRDLECTASVAFDKTTNRRCCRRELIDLIDATGDTRIAKKLIETGTTDPNASGAYMLNIGILSVLSRTKAPNCVPAATLERLEKFERVSGDATYRTNLKTAKANMNCASNK